MGNPVPDQQCPSESSPGWLCWQGCSAETDTPHPVPMLLSWMKRLLLTHREGPREIEGRWLRLLIATTWVKLAGPALRYLNAITLNCLCETMQHPVKTWSVVVAFD